MFYLNCKKRLCILVTLSVILMLHVKMHYYKLCNRIQNKCTSIRMRFANSEKNDVQKKLWSDAKCSSAIRNAVFWLGNINLTMTRNCWIRVVKLIHIAVIRFYAGGGLSGAVGWALLGAVTWRRVDVYLFETSVWQGQLYLRERKDGLCQTWQ